MEKENRRSKAKGRRVAAVTNTAGSVTETGSKIEGPKDERWPPEDDGEGRLELPDPEFLARCALQETHRKLLENYRETICILRDQRGFSFREIAEWLTENGLVADYNGVYRIYTKGMPKDAVARLDKERADDREN